MADRPPWFVAAWPGMGSVAVLAGTYLVHELGAQPVGQVSAREYFDVQQVEVRRGLLQPAQYPQSTLYAWQNPDGPDLLVCLAEAQPQVRGFALCESLISEAVRRGARRAITFAAMATPSDPRARARVFAAATDAALLGEVRQQEVQLLREGAITGLNGVLLAAGKAQGIPGVCLLGEVPFYASAIPQPKAAAAVLRVFSNLSGIELDLARLDLQAELVEERLVELLGRLEEEARAQGAGEGSVLDRLTGGEGPDSRGDEAEDELDLDLSVLMGGEEGEEEAEGGEEGEDAEAPPPRKRLEPGVVTQIETLFGQAGRDRGKALQLKALLDQHGVFKEYEDRFLDLFREAA